MKPLITFVLLIAATSCFAQKQDVYFVKDDGSYVTHRDSADYIRIIKEPVSGSDYFDVSEYYLNGKIKLLGESSSPSYPKFEGTAIRYYPNGKKSAVNIYKNGGLTGIQYEFFPNGKPYIVKTHTIEQKSPPITNIVITSNFDSLGKALVVEGNGHFIRYDKDFKYIAEEGDLKNGKKEGEWKFNQDSLSAVELYKEDKFISGTSNFKGEIKNYTVASAPPSFRGGIDSFLRYIGDNINYPAEDRRNGIQGTVLAQFIVERDGKLSNIKILRAPSRGMENEAIRVIKRSQTWIPGTQFGRTVRAIYTIPINFSLGSPF
jgi:TonB family protein